MAKKDENNPKLTNFTTSTEPLMAGSGFKEIKASSDKARRNRAGTIERTDKYANISNGLIPFNRSTTNIYSASNMDVRDAVILCQKCYYNFAIFRNTIDLMTEFSSSKIYFKGGSQKSRDFFEALFDKINLWSFQDKFFREYYRSGNVFIYRFDTNIKEDDLIKITQTFGVSKAASVILPARYIIINPADIQIGGNISFVSNKFYKVLSDYELERLRNPRTQEDQEVYDALPDDVKENIKKKTNSAVMPLDTARLVAVFYKKQDYEPFSVPMGYPVLEDINAKAEMRKMDMAVTRTTQQAILLVTMGTDPDKGGVNQKNLEAMQTLFQNESVGRVLIADYTTKAEFVIPAIADLLDPKKYEVIDRDIQIGLNNILIGDEKFANQSIKVQVFIERLKQAREAFINEFLFPEIVRISKSLGFKNYPTPYFEDIDLKDDIQYARVYNRLVELGVLTPEEGLTAIETGRLPDPEASLESQIKYKELRDQGYYTPLIGGSQPQAGRPAGSSTPQSTKNVSPIGTGQQSRAEFSAKKVSENFALASKLEEHVSDLVKQKFNIKRLNKQQKSIIDDITKMIVANENVEQWIETAYSYVESPVDKNQDNIKETLEIASNHQVDSYIAGILRNSKV
jgi:hypothetical protein